MTKKTGSNRANRRQHIHNWRERIKVIRESAYQRIEPISPDARLGAVDAVRGFALFGVLLVNMYNFGADSPEWSGVLDRGFRAVTHALFETKSLRLLSLLFGVGFALQLARVRLGDSRTWWFHVRRLTILFLFGMVHALFFDGDILMEYAMLGLILLAFVSINPRTLPVLAFALLAVFPIGNLLHTESSEDLADYREDSLPLAELRIDHPYLGTPRDVFQENAFAIPPTIWSNLHDPESSLVIFAMFLLGLYVGRSSILQRPEFTPLIRRVCVWGIGLGATSALAEWTLSKTYGYAVFTENSAPDGVRLLGDLLFAYGSTALSLGYGAGIVFLARSGVWKSILWPLQAIGRMSLTAYLSSTAMFTTLFYGWGFGKLFLLGPAATTGFAILFFLTLLFFCNWWLARFRFGPAEWLWRSLTYMTPQPLRRRR